MRISGRYTMTPPPMTITAWLRWDAIERLLPDRAARVLDIGAGTGSIGAMLARRYDYVGIEPDPVSFATAERRVGRLGTLLNCAWEDLPAAADFDLVCAFEVLEHIRDDREALASWMDHLRPGASLLVSVPSGTRRYGPANARVGDLRRYDESALLALLSSLGLRGLQARRYGAPYGHVQEALLNALAGDDADESMAERTAASARSMQPPRVFSYAVAAVALPLRLVQRPLARVGLGTGLVCRGDKRLPPTRSG